jgi:hypothetical protein
MDFVEAFSAIAARLWRLNGQGAQEDKLRGTASFSSICSQLFGCSIVDTAVANVLSEEQCAPERYVARETMDTQLVVLQIA